MTRIRYNRKSITIFTIIIILLYLIFLYMYSYSVAPPKKWYYGPLDCDLLFHSDQRHQTKAERMKASYFDRIFNANDRWISTNDSVMSNENCHRYKTFRGFILNGIPSEEAQFKIAFSIVIHHDFVMFEKLLRMIYRPHNIYCIHIDSKAPIEFIKKVSALVSCFPNIHLASEYFNVEWGRFSQLQAELICMKNLIDIDSNWKYLINLAGQEFPLRTNWELVQILKVFNGANNIEALPNHELYARIPKRKLPQNVKLIKGSLRMVVTREFVQFLLSDKLSKKILNILWEHDNLTKQGHPDEMFFSTLNNNPQVIPAPGANLGPIETTDITNQFISRYVKWEGLSAECPSKKMVRGVCILGVKDLPILVSLRELFVNKFHSTYQPAAIICFEEWLYNKTIDQYAQGSTNLDLSYYKRLTFVQKHL